MGLERIMKVQITLRLETLTETHSAVCISEMVKQILLEELPLELKHEHIIHEIWWSDNDS